MISKLVMERAVFRTCTCNGQTSLRLSDHAKYCPAREIIKAGLGDHDVPDESSQPTDMDEE